MSKSPKKKKPTDVVGNAIRVAQIATGEIEPDADESDDGKNKTAVELGRRGGRARAKSISAERRKEIAQKAAAKRWKNKTE